MSGALVVANAAELAGRVAALAPLDRLELVGRVLRDATRADEVVWGLDELDMLKVAARKADNRAMQADVIEMQMRGQRTLGRMLDRARRDGLLGAGRRAAAAPRIRLDDIGVSRKLSMLSQRLAGADADLFERMIAENRAKIEAGRAVVVNPARDLSTADKALRRRLREAQLAQRQRALPDKVYGVIYADPEWRFETRSPAGMDRAADNHYPTSDLAAIKARPVGTLAAPDCALFLWATDPMLDAALDVARFWGFTRRNTIVWNKLDIGTGFNFRSQCEFLLYCTRGNVPGPAPGTQWPNYIAARRTAHSEKPVEAYELIESYFPSLPKIELNARRRRPGWDVWGLEAPDDDDADSAPHPGGGAATPLPQGEREGAEAAGGRSQSLPPAATMEGVHAHAG